MDKPAARTTRQRTAVGNLLQGLDSFRTAQQIHDLLRERGEAVGLTTVYRTLTGMAEAGEVDVLRTPQGENAYRRCSERHHHHLVCTSCGRTVEVEDPVVDDLARRIGREHGFHEIGHDLEFRGVCDACYPG